jgi:hypothetical protein
VSDRLPRAAVEPGIAVTAARTASRDIRRCKASNYAQTVRAGLPPEQG